MVDQLNEVAKDSAGVLNGKKQARLIEYFVSLIAERLRNTKLVKFNLTKDSISWPNGAESQEQCCASKKGRPRKGSLAELIKGNINIIKSQEDLNQLNKGLK